MKFSKLLFLMAAIVALATPIYAQQTKPTVMVLGTYHMSNPGRDLNNVKADDVLAEKRQKEIAELVALLKKYKPTKIALEIPAAKSAYLERYAQYAAGTYQLTNNEVDQIGFRLAKEMNLPKVYSIDWQGNFDFDKVLASAAANNQSAVTDKMLAFGKSETEKMGEMMRTKTVVEMLRYMNSDEFVERSHQPYLAFARIGKDADYAGADLTADWYERNLKIYANITRITDSPNDRILVLIGAGHLKLLREFVEQSGEFNSAKPNVYF